MTEEICAIMYMDDRAARRMMARVISQAVREVTGTRRVTSMQRWSAQDFLLSEWAYLWADALGIVHHLERMCREIADDRSVPYIGYCNRRVPGRFPARTVPDRSGSDQESGT